MFEMCIRDSKSIVLSVAGSVRIYGDKASNSLAFNILASYSVTRALRSDHDNVQIISRCNPVSYTHLWHRRGWSRSLTLSRKAALPRCSTLLWKATGRLNPYMNCLLYTSHVEWAPNEKVGVEVAMGASIGGVRSLSCMKHVGLNVAADPFFTACLLYTSRCV